MEPVLAVAAGDEAKPAWCDGCMTSDGYETKVFAMVPSGLQQIATITGCNRCGTGPTVNCFFCPQAAAGGVEFFHHIRDWHSDQAGG